MSALLSSQPAPDGDDSTDAGLPSSSLLRWHVLASVACLTRGSSVPSGDAPAPGTNLLKRLLALPTPDLLDACAPDQTTGAPGGLIAHVGAIGTLAGKPGFAWGAGAAGTYTVRLRKLLPGNELYLSPDALLVPWPFGMPLAPVDGAKLAEDYDKAREPAGRPEIPDATPTELQPTVAMPLTAFMLAVDDALDPASPCRAGFATRIHDDGLARQWLAERAKVRGLPSSAVLPTNLSVHVNPDMETTRTRWKVVNGHLHLSLGWLPPDKAAPMLNQWPCGAFRGFPFEPGPPC